MTIPDQREQMVKAWLKIEQESPTRVSVRIQGEVWDGVQELGRIEIDIARHLDPRVSIAVSRLDEPRTGPVEAR